jgi:hypothetical protein
MSFNGTGTFLINTAGQPVVASTVISATTFNLLTADLANGLTNTITKDGQTTVTANIPMSNFKITGLGAATTANDAVRLEQLTSGATNVSFGNLTYTGTLTGGTGVVNLGSGQFYKDASGNVGIGTALPQRKLNVAGSVVGLRLNEPSTTPTIQYVEIGNASNATLFGTIGVDSSGNQFVGNQNNAALYFSTNNAERVRIDSSGALLVGTTSRSFGQSGFIIDPSYTAAGNSGAAIQHINGSASGSNYLSFIYNAGLIGNISQNGTTGVLYNLTSDYRLKNDPQPLTGSKDFIMALQPKKWQWWDGSGEGVGFIAHEFMEVAKHSGNGKKDAVDADNKPVYQSIQPSSSEVMANLIALVQEQQALITQLQTDVAILKGN